MTLVFLVLLIPIYFILGFFTNNKLLRVSICAILLLALAGTVLYIMKHIDDPPQGSPIITYDEWKKPGEYEE
jgi:hypothetical protein